MKKDEIDRLLSQTYYDPASAGSFGGVAPLLRRVNELLVSERRRPLPRRVVVDWLRGSEPYSVHRQSSDKFERNPIKVNAVNELWQMDVVFYPDLARFNKGFGYVLAVLDTASRFLYVRFMKRKTCAECLSAFREVLDEAGTAPKLLMSDRGKEFLCEEMRAFFRERGIRHYHKHSGQVQVPHLDRALRTVQTRLHRLFTHGETRDLLTNLPLLVRSYNASFNRAIGMTPAEALTRWKPPSPPADVVAKPARETGGRALRKGQYVRLLGIKAGHHAYKGDWTFEIFRVRLVKRRAGRRTQYYVSDLRGRRVEGAHYRDELQLVKRPPRDKEYKIERVLRHRTDSRGRKQALVKWMHLPQTQWVDVERIRNVV